MIQCVVNFSGGAGSFVAAVRAIEVYGPEETLLLFCDTRTEDADLYRFLDDCERVLPAKLVRIEEGRNLWERGETGGLLGNARHDPCSLYLKRQLADRWVNSHCPWAVRVFGIDYSESHRAERIRKRAQFKSWFPLLEKPHLTKEGQMAEIRRHGIEPPRLYALGAPHNNCGGACVKAGQAHFRWLYATLPCVYADWERNEERLRKHWGKDVSIMTKIRKGVKSTYTLREFRADIEAGLPPGDEEWGGCGCFVDM